MNRDQRLETLHPLFRAADNALRKYVALIQQNPNADDESLERQLLAQGCERSLVQSVIAFVPLAFGRVIVDGLGVKASNSYIHSDPATGVQREYDLNREIVFTWAKCVVPEYAGTPEFRQVFEAIAHRSAEVDAINNALYGGVSEASLRESALAPNIITLTNHASHPKKPWWKFW